MDVYHDLAIGFAVALSPLNIAYGLCGVLLGTLVGLLPGLGPVSTIALLLPASFGLPAESALIMLAGVYYGSQYGGSTSAILLNLPGEPSSIVTCLDGHQMTRAGRAGVALTTAAIGSFVAGSLGTAAIVVAAPLLTRLGLAFGPAEFASLMIGGLAMTIGLSETSPLSSTAMVLLGLLVGLVGADLTFGVERFTFGWPQLSDGVSLVAVAIGLFGLADIMDHLRHGEEVAMVPDRHRARLPDPHERRAASGAVLRGTLIGGLLGVLPGSGAVLSSFAAYAIEKKRAADPSRFGRGAIEGVAAPEAANNAAAQTSFIPLLTLGVPSSAVMALMLGAMTIHGVVPGPDLSVSQPRLFWGLIASMWVGNLLLLVLNLPLIGLWAKLIAVPARVLTPAILLIASTGVYSVSHSMTDVLLMAGFAAAGYLFIRLRCDRTAFLLGYVLGPLLEEHLRRAMTFAGGDPTVFLRRPISLLMLVGAAGIIAASARPASLALHTAATTSPGTTVTP